MEIGRITRLGERRTYAAGAHIFTTGEIAPGAMELRGLFAEALTAYRERDWDLAEQKFQKCLKLAPEDGPSRLFEQRVAFLRANPPAAGWQGVWQATEK